MTVISSLENVLNHTKNYWNLEIQEDQIAESSYLSSLFQWMYSFFSSEHLNNLKDKLVEVLNNNLEPSKEKEKITLEKIARVIDKGSQTWLKGLNNHLTQPLKVSSEKSFRPSDGLIQPKKEKGYFVNYYGESIFWQFCETMRLFFPGMFSSSTQLEDVEILCQRDEVLARSEKDAFTWIGHSTLLMQLNGINLLFDPSFGFCPPCFPRHTKPGIALKDLPLIDAIFVSHNHHDHCEPKALEDLSVYQPLVFSPDRFGYWFKDKDYQVVHNMKWWQTATLKRGDKTVKITSVPAIHNSQTSVSDANRSHWQGCVIECNQKKIYFAGDTAYSETLFKQLKKEFGLFDMVFMPVAPEHENAVHVDVQESLQAFDKLEAKEMIPIHFGAYRQGREVLEDPLNRLKSFLDKEFKHLKDKVSLYKIGQRFEFSDKIQSERKSA